MENQENVVIKLTGENLNFTAKINFFQATQIMSFIARPTDASTQYAQDSVPSRLSQPAERTYESPRDAITKLGASTNPQKIVAFALFKGASSHNGQTFNSDEIRDLFKRAGLAIPKNLNRDLKEAVRLGYIDEEQKGAFRLLSSTDKVEEEGFKKAKKTSARRSTRGTSKTSGAGRKPALKARDEFIRLPVKTAFEGYPGFYKLKQRSDQILWILAYAKTHGVNGLNRTEIIEYSNKVGGKVSSQAFTSSNVPNVKENRVWQQHELWYINESGDLYLKNLASDENK